MKTLESGMESIETKIDVLTGVVEKGFKETRKGFAKTGTEIAKNWKEIEELRNMTAKSFSLTPTTTDLEDLKGYMDIKLDQYVGKFRKDYDSLAGRTRTIENICRKQGLID